MLYKLSRINTVHKIGVLVVRIFSIYNKKRFKVLKYYGVVKASINKVNKYKSWLLGYRVRGYIIQTKNSKIRFDGSSYLFFFNRMYIKNRKLKRKKLIFGPIQKNISNRKYLYKFSKIL